VHFQIKFLVNIFLKYILRLDVTTTGLMSKYFKQRIKKIGQSPGTLGPTETLEKAQVAFIAYSNHEFIEKERASLDECGEIKNKTDVLWINVLGINDPTTIQSIGSLFGLHPLLLEDIMSIDQRAKLDDYKDYIYIVIHLLNYSPDKDKIESTQISLVLGQNFLISFVEADIKNHLFHAIYERLRGEHSRFREKGADYLCYSIIDLIVDHYFIILETMDEKLEKIEDELLGTPKANTSFKIQKVKRQITLLRKAVWPIREVISKLRRIDSPLLQESTKLYIQDAYDHTIQIIDTIESFRDIASGMLDIYLSNISFRMNEIMKLLTIVSTIFVPLTFIASIYGMNFEHIPELKMKYGYPLILLVMLCIAIGMLVYFRRKKWI
jgi:magnesium transporter